MSVKTNAFCTHVSFQLRRKKLMCCLQSNPNTLSFYIHTYRSSSITEFDLSIFALLAFWFSSKSYDLYQFQWQQKGWEWSKDMGRREWELGEFGVKAAMDLITLLNGTLASAFSLTASLLTTVTITPTSSLPIPWKTP